LIEVGLIGCGYWGTNLCRVLAQHPDFKLRWVCDSTDEALGRAARIAPSARRSAKVMDLLNDGTLDAIVIATPVGTHYDLTRAALQAGKHVLVEKPLCQTELEGLELCTAAGQAKRVLMVGHTFLYNAAVRRVKAMIDAGNLGEIRYVFTRRLNLGIVRKDVDVLWSLAPHDLSILNYWLPGPVERVAAIGHCYLQPGIADVAFAHLTYKGNAAGHVQVSWLDPHKIRQATVVGSKQMLFYDDMSADQRIVVYDKGIDIPELDAGLGSFETFAQYQLKVRAGDAWLPRLEFKEPLVEQITEFAGCIREERSPLADGQNGLEVVRLLQRLSAAMAAGSSDER
jgi:predicted dehydrogenase